MTKRFGTTTVVNNVSLRVADGEWLVLLGTSGSGKTTTLKMTNRLVEPSAGMVTIDGKDVAAVDPHALRRSIGYVFQRIGLFPHMTVGQNIAVPLLLAGWQRPAIAARVRELMKMLELDDSLIDRRPAALSGGQSQRVGVARALASRPRILLLDEPFGALDPLTRGRLWQSLLRIRESAALTAIFVTHDIVEGLTIGHRLGVMVEGRLVQIGTPQELFAAPKHEFVAGLVASATRQARAIDAIMSPEPL